MAEQTKLADIVKTDGLGKALEYAEGRLASDTAFAKDCHPLMHTLGHAAYKLFGSFAGAQHERGELCNSGYIHGLIEAGFISQDDPNQAMLQTCPAGQSTSFNQWQCFHGLGHGAMYVSNRDAAASLRLCGLLETDFAKDSCNNGVFMELFNLVDHTGHTNSSRIAHTDYSICDTQPERTKSDCYFYAPTTYISLHPGDYDGAAKKCGEVESYGQSCYLGVGSQIMKDNITEPWIAASFCGTLAPARTCARGAISLYINHHASSQAAEPLCFGEFREFVTVCQDVIDEKHQLYDI